MLIDNHVHVGWYSDGYHSPIEVWKGLKNAGVSRAAFSSTSTCAELYHNIKTEFYQLISLAGKENVTPILWITPNMLLKKWPLKFLIKSQIEWKGIKCHFVAHPQFANSQFWMNEFVCLARHLGNLPVLFHTGEWEYCRAGAFEPIIKENPDLTFVLAHGRPINETVDLLQRYSNVWTDTAFMPFESILKLREEGLTARTMFGSDAPINRIFYPYISTSDYLRASIAEIRHIAPEILSNCVYNN